MFEVEYKQLDSTDESNKYVVLNGTPIDSSNVAMDTIGGTAQFLAGDFAVDGTKITWGGYALDGTMTSGDRIRIRQSGPLVAVRCLRIQMRRSR